MVVSTSSSGRLDSASPVSRPQDAVAPPRMPVPEPKVRVGERPESPPEGAAAPHLDLRPDEEQFLQEALGFLTSREREVVLAICRGGTNEAIAGRLCIALPTLRTHLMRLNQKLHTTSKGDVVRHAAAIVIDGYRTGRIAAGTGTGPA